MTSRRSRAVRIAAIVFAIACAAARSSFADGEGIYCVGPDYLAYEFNGDGMAPGPHQLWVVNLAGKTGASAPVSVELESFQTRGLRCVTDAVAVLGPTSVFIVGLDSSRQPQTPIAHPIVAHERPVDFDPAKSLGASAAAFLNGVLPARIALDTPATPMRFALEMSGVPRRTEGEPTTVPCWMEEETRLVTLGASGAAGSGRTLSKGIVARKCAVTDFDGENSNGTGAPLAASACAATHGRQARQVVGDVLEGADFSQRIGPFELQLQSEGEDGWDLAVLEPGRLDDLAQLTSPPHGPSPTEIRPRAFRNDDNTGPPTQPNAELGDRHRRFVFSPEVGRTMIFNLDTLADDRERAAAYGRGTFDILEYEMTPRQLGESSRILRMKFAACLTWPQ